MPRGWYSILGDGKSTTTARDGETGRRDTREEVREEGRRVEDGCRRGCGQPEVC